MPTIGSSRGRPPMDPWKVASPKAKMPPSDGHQPVAVTGRRRRHAHNRLVEGQPAHGPQVRGVAEGEDAAVGADQPVAAAARRRCHAHDGCRQHLGGQVAQRRKGPIGEYPSECRDHAVAAATCPGGQGRHPAVGEGRETRRGRWRGRSRRGARPAGGVHLGRAVVHRDRRRAGRVHGPRRDARHDPAHDPPDAVDLLVALAVAELEAPGDPRVAAVGAAATRGAVTSRLAETPPAAAAGGAAALGVAVHVVPGTPAVRGVVGLPPPTHHGVGRAVVVPVVDRAAELREPRAARRTAPAGGVGAGAHGPVGRARAQQEVDARPDGHRAAHQRRPVDEAPPGEPRGRGTSTSARPG